MNGSEPLTTRPGTLADLHARFGWSGVVYMATGCLVWSAVGAVILVGGASAVIGWVIR
jgi:hypothetical protein